MCALVALAMTGCSEQAENTPALASVSSTVRLAPLSPDGTPSPEARQANAQAALGALMLVDQATAGATSWREARDRAYDAARDSDLPRGVLDQTVAATLLQHFVLPATTPEMRAEAVRQAETLVATGSPEAGLIADALEAGRGEISTPKRAVLAQRAAEVARDALRREADCEGCTRAEIERRLGVEAPDDATLAGLRRLEALTSAAE